MKCEDIRKKRMKQSDDLINYFNKKNIFMGDGLLIMTCAMARVVCHFSVNDQREFIEYLDELITETRKHNEDL